MNMMYKKILQTRILKRIYLERLGEPFLYNIVSLFVFFFGGMIKKIEYDLIPRQPYAFGLNDAFKNAKAENCNEIVIVEFGVASGAGIYNLASIAEKLYEIYNIQYTIYGFDSGQGMPKPIDYRDHPEKYFTGDYPPENLEGATLPKNVEIIYGNISKTIGTMKDHLSKNKRLGFISIDVDYYSSTIDCLEVLKWEEYNYLSKITCYFDDVNNIDHNEYCGELLAINEFNKGEYPRRITKMNQLKNWRIFKHALWLDQMYYAHVFDSPVRENHKISKLSNPYLD